MPKAMNEATRRLLDDPEPVKKLQRGLIDWFYPKLTEEELAESRRERGLPDERTD